MYKNTEIHIPIVEIISVVIIIKDITTVEKYRKKRMNLFIGKYTLIKTSVIILAYSQISIPSSKSFHFFRTTIQCTLCLSMLLSATTIYLEM